jgi:peptide/nickel transport system permease protein
MILKRLAMVIPMLLLVSIGVFGLQLLIPGDAATSLAGSDATPERIQQVRQLLGLQKPVVTRYLDWIGNALHGDFGKSLFTYRSVGQEIVSRWAVTGSLVIGAVLLALLLSVPLALLAARRPGGALDRSLTVTTSFGVAVPNFVVGMVLVTLFAIWVRWLPIAGYVGPTTSVTEWIRHLFLPVIALAAPMVSVLARQLRSDLGETFRRDYIRTAQAKGLKESVVLVKHGLRAAAPPTVSILGVQIARLLGGAVVIETVFALPGLGQLTVNAILNRDLPVIQGVIPLTVIVAVVANLGADVLNMILSPRTRAGVD